MCAPLGDQTAPPTPGRSGRESPLVTSWIQSSLRLRSFITSKPTRVNRTFEPSGETVGFSTPSSSNRSIGSSGRSEAPPGRARPRRGGGWRSAWKERGLVWPREAAAGRDHMPRDMGAESWMVAKGSSTVRREVRDAAPTSTS